MEGPVKELYFVVQVTPERDGHDEAPDEVAKYTYDGITYDSEEAYLKHLAAEVIADISELGHLVETKVMQVSPASLSARILADLGSEED
jgi:hypothetical protein